jgi:hypothetical protein
VSKVGRASNAATVDARDAARMKSLDSLGLCEGACVRFNMQPLHSWTTHRQILTE